MCPWSLFLVALRARSWLGGFNNRPDPARKIGPVPCHVMASRAMPGHIFACHAIFLRVMPCHEYSMPCHVRIFWENVFLKNLKSGCMGETYFQEFDSFFFDMSPASGYMGEKYFQEFGPKFLTCL